jgi:HEAT repeat protein
MQKNARLLTKRGFPMLTPDALKDLRAAYASGSSAQTATVLAALGDPADELIVASALSGLRDGDRNLRVLMLRVLAFHSGPQAMSGILSGLGDEERRVREVALKSSANYLSYVQISERMAELATDKSEKTKIRHLALDSLAGLVGGNPAVKLPANAARALAKLAEERAMRMPVLQRLVRLDMTNEVEAMLRSFSAGSDETEVQLATKALAGYRAVNLGQFQDEATRKEIARSCEPAFGRVIFWIPRTEQVAQPIR